MAKKKQAAKTAAPPAPTTSLQSFEAEIAATLNDERTRVQREIYHLKQDHHKNGVYDEIMKLGREEGFLKAKEGFMRTLKVAATTQFEKGKLEGFEEGRAAGKAEAENLRNEETAVHVDLTTQTTPLDEPTATPSPPLSATSPLTTPAQPPSALSTLLTATTTIPSPPSKQSPAPRERRHSLPDRPVALPSSPQPRHSRPELAVATATSQPPTPALPAATASETASRASSSTKTVTYTSDTASQAINNVQRPSTAQQTELREYEGTRSLERVVHATDDSCQPHHPQRRSGKSSTPPSSLQLAPLTPVTHDESPTGAATSQTTPPASLALPLPERHPTAPNEPQTAPQWLESRPARRVDTKPSQNPCTRTATPPLVWYTPPASPMTPSAPANAPRSSPASCSPPVRPSSPQPDPKRAVSPTPARFDWADDAASIPIAPSSYPRDLSGLKTGNLQPFGTLRQRTRRRRRPRHLFLPPQQSFLLPYVYPSHSQPFITRCHPSGIGPGKPVTTVPSGTPTPATPVLGLNWDQDPRLVNLSQALRALGWIPPC